MIEYQGEHKFIVTNLKGDGILEKAEVKDEKQKKKPIEETGIHRSLRGDFNGERDTGLCRRGGDG